MKKLAASNRQLGQGLGRRRFDLELILAYGTNTTGWLL